jgi:hypothetical protein
MNLLGGGTPSKLREALVDAIDERGVKGAAHVVDGIADEQLQDAIGIVHRFDQKSHYGSGLLVRMLREDLVKPTPAPVRPLVPDEPDREGEVWMSHAELVARHNARAGRVFVGNVKSGITKQPTFADKAEWPVPKCDGDLVLVETPNGGVWVAECDVCGEEIGIPRKDRQP